MAEVHSRAPNTAPAVPDILAGVQAKSSSIIFLPFAHKFYVATVNFILHVVQNRCPTHHCHTLPLVTDTRVSIYEYFTDGEIARGISGIEHIWPFFLKGLE